MSSQETTKNVGEGQKQAENSPVPKAQHGGNEADRWQRRLLPLMIVMLCVLTVFFFVASLLQVYQVENQINNTPQLDLKTSLDKFDYKDPEVKVRDKIEHVRWATLSALEEASLKNRYHQANVLLITRTWIKYIGFVTGMILALVGAVFILGKLSEKESKLGGGNSWWNVSMSTTSPGLILALLGTILMVTTIAINPPIDVTDSPLYISEDSLLPTEEPEQPTATQNGNVQNGNVQSGNVQPNSNSTVRRRVRRRRAGRDSSVIINNTGGSDIPTETTDRPRQAGVRRGRRRGR
jgi:hypothetical protein